MNPFYHLKPFIKPNLPRFILGIFVLILVDIIQLIPLRIIGQLTDNLVNKSANIQMIIRYAIIIIILGIIMSICKFLWRYLIIGTSRRLETWLRKTTFNHILSLPSSFFDTHKTGNLSALCTNDIRAIRMAFGIGTIMVVDSFFMTIIVCITMFVSIDHRLTIFAIMPLPFIAISVVFMGKAIKTKFFEVQDNFGTLTNKVQESLAGIRVTKAFANEDVDVKDFETFNVKNYKSYISLAKYDSALFPIVQFIASLSLIIALTYGGHLVINGIITLGALVTFIGYLAKLTWPMIASGYVVNLIQRSIVSMTRISNLLNEPTVSSYINTNKSDSDITNVSYRIPNNTTIKFDNVSFSYNEAHIPTLQNINFTLNTNSTLGIVGRTGCGKSTIPKLLLKLYKPTSGNIYIGDTPLNNFSDSELRQIIGFVPQETFLFSKSINENISFYDSNAAYEDIIRVCKLAEFHNEVIKFPNGYDTQLGERGVNLSGGQKQRLSIARALIRNPKIIIFDDSLSAVDTNTEYKILNNIKQTTQGKQSIIISHRISTLLHADFIIVLDKGKIVESGTHDELMKNKSIYFDMYTQQQSEQQDEITNEKTIEKEAIHEN